MTRNLLTEDPLTTMCDLPPNILQQLGGEQVTIGLPGFQGKKVTLDVEEDEPCK
jgi:hypothetical protein